MQGPCFHLWAHSEVLGVRTATYNILGTQLNPFPLDMLLPPSNMFFFWKLSHPRRSSPSWTLSSPCALCILPLPLTCASRLCPTASRPAPAPWTTPRARLFCTLYQAGPDCGSVESQRLTRLPSLPPNLRYLRSPSILSFNTAHLPSSSAVVCFQN